VKCIQVRGINDFIITEAPLSNPMVDEITIKVLVTGLCRTDLKLIRDGHRDLILPRIPGEEVVGVIYAKGADVTEFNEGDFVYVYPGIWCGHCPACKNNAENLCREMKIMGFHRDGGFAEYVNVPAQSVIRLPQGLEPELAVFAEPLSCCLNALEIGNVRAGQSVGIWGAGPAGTLLYRAARAMGAESFSIEPDERRRILIGGYETCPDRTFDVCVVAVGSKHAYEEAIQKLAPLGRLIVFSGLSFSDDRQMTVSFNQLHYLEQTVVGAYGCCFRHGKQALTHIADGTVPVRDMISHRMSLYGLETALKYVEQRAGMKILLYP